MGRHCDEVITTCSNDSCYPGVPCMDKTVPISCGQCPSGFTGNGKNCKGISNSRQLECLNLNQRGWDQANLHSGNALAYAHHQRSSAVRLLFEILFILGWGISAGLILHYCMQFCALMQEKVKRLPKAPKCIDIGRSLTCIDTALIGGDSREHRRLIKVGRIHKWTLSLDKPFCQINMALVILFYWLQLNSFDWIPYIKFLIRFGCIRFDAKTE